jgi:hypothetical protein
MGKLTPDNPANVAEVSLSDGEPASVLMIRAGRGNSGGTTALNATIELALREGRKPVVLDAARNPSLSAIYPDTAFRPASHSIGDVKEAITSGVLDVMVEESRSGVIDLGGGQDDTLVDYMLDIDLVKFCQSVGVRPVFLVSFGPQLDDFEHALEIKRRGVFSGADVLLVQNEGVLRRGQDPDRVFGEIQRNSDFINWVTVDNACPLYMETLACLEEVRKLGLSLSDAAANKPGRDGKKIGITKAWTVKTWLNDWALSFHENECDERRV